MAAACRVALQRGTLLPARAKLPAACSCATSTLLAALRCRVVVVVAAVAVAAAAWRATSSSRSAALAEASLGLAGLLVRLQRGQLGLRITQRVDVDLTNGG
jgi:hypothetical protein